MPALDDTDFRILRTLQAEPDLTVAMLAERVGLSHTPCWRRLRRLEENGTIAGRRLLIDPAVLGFDVAVIAEITLKEHHEDVLNAFEQAVQAHPQIVQCYSMGGNSDYIVQVISRGIPEYESLLKKVLLHLPGVASVKSHFVLNKVKCTSDLPI